MNPWQLAQQIQEELKTVLWTGGSADFVFGARGVFVTTALLNDENLPAGFPFAIVSIDGAVADTDHPEFLTQEFTVMTAVEVAGDPLGQHAVIGGAVADLGKSVGRGVAEVSERTRSAVQNLLGVDGAKIQISATSIGTPQALGNGLHIVQEETTLSALCTSQLHYSFPQELVRSGTTWTWEGAHCSDRWDFRQYTLGYVAGSTPAATLADITTTVYTGTAATTTHSVVASKAYSVFAEYNARGGASASSTEGSSAGNEVGAFLTS